MAIQLDAALSESIPKKRSERIKNKFSKLTGRVKYSVSRASNDDLNARRSSGIQKAHKPPRTSESDRSRPQTPYGRPEARKSFKARSPLEPRKLFGDRKPFDRSSQARKPVKPRKPFGDAKKGNKETMEDLDAELDAYMNREN